jgi:anti-sigma factor RsiW
MTRRRSEQRDKGHDYVLERLSPYIDDQLSGEERTRVAAHLRACSSCREELRTLQWTRGLLQQVPTVPVPRSFVIREADLAPQHAAWRPLAGLQWATALVAILLVVVVAGDMFLGGRPVVSPGSEPQVAMVREKAPDKVVTVVVESETVVEAPEARVATEEKAEAETPAEAPRMLIAATPVVETDEVGEMAQPAEVMGEGGPVTDTATALPMMVEAAPDKAAPEALPEGNGVLGEAPLPQELPAVPTQDEQPAQEILTAPPPEEQALEPTGEPPLAMAPPAEPQEEEPPIAVATVESPERGARWMSPELLARVGWRVAEVGLGLLLLGLVVTIVWLRRRK